MSDRVRIKDIAEAADVSITTVSHALNGKGRVSEAVRERVRRAAEELGYRASTRAQGLATGRAMTLAIQIAGAEEGILPDFTFFVQMLNGASAAALERGYALVVLPARDTAELMRHLELDGAIISDPTGDEPLFDIPGLPIVTTARAPGRRVLGAVDNDIRVGTRAVLEHFLEQGCERPAILTTRAGQSYVDDTVAEYEEFCAEKGLRPIVGRVNAAPTETAAIPAATRLLKRKRRPDAIYTTLDRTAVGVLTAARELDLDVPRDVAVAANTDSVLLRAVSPQVTVLDVNPPRIGADAVRLLLDQLEADRPRFRSITVPSRLIVRPSTLRAATKREAA